MQRGQFEYLVDIGRVAVPDEFVDILRDEEDPAVLRKEKEEPLHGLEVGQTVPEKWWIRLTSIAHWHQGCM